MNDFTTSCLGRRLHVVDVENLLGGGDFAVDEVTRLRDGYLRLTASAVNDHVVLGASGGASALASGLGWSGQRVVLQHGVNGADLALLSVLGSEHITDRFGAVYIASGDGIFAETAAEIAARGIPVTVVSRARSLSRRLRMAATNVVLLDWPTLAPIDSGVAA